MPEPVVKLELVQNPIVRVWNYIGSDVYQVAAEMGERVKNAEAIESCIDANRLTMVANSAAEKAIMQAAEAEIDRAIKAHGYDKVLKFLARKIQLV